MESDEKLCNDKIIIEYFFSNNGLGRFCPTKLKNLNNDEFIKYLENRYLDSSSLLETIYRIKYNIANRPKCKICGGYVKFNTLHNTFDNTCCKECGNKYRSLNKTNAIIKKYGVDNVFKSKNIIEKIKETKFTKYGDSGYNNHEKTVKTCLEKYGVSNVGQIPEIIENNKQYFLSYYGVTSPSKLQSSKEKSKETCLNIYGYEYSHQNIEVRSKTSKTIQNRSKEKQDEISKNISNSLNNRSEQDKKITKEKRKQTFLEKYGVDNYFKTEECKLKSHSKEAIEKSFNTQRKNNTLKSSKAELETFELLKQLFNDVIHQYKDNRYPFRCDFYIPSLDLFIECQYGMFHNKKPYVGSFEDKIELEKFKQRSLEIKKNTGKSKTRYDALIETWTIRDVKKRNIAKENNLNYLEFFSILDLKMWIENYGK